MNKTLTAGMASGVLSLSLAPSVFATDMSTYMVTVSPSDLGTWADISVSGGSASYVDGAPAGLGANSLELKTTSDVNAKATFAHQEDMPLNQLTDASYWTKQVAASSDGGSAAMTLAVDLNGDGTWDTNLVFEPYWQNNTSPDATPVVKGEWQKWDVASGLFWSSRNFGDGDAALKAGSGGAPFYSLANIKANYPNARLMAVGVSVGTYNTDYIIDVDGINVNGTVYNFEKTAGNSVPGTPKSKDDCKDGGWKALQSVDGRMFKNQGQCVSYEAHSKNEVNYRYKDASESQADIELKSRIDLINR